MTPGQAASHSLKRASDVSTVRLMPFPPVPPSPPAVPKHQPLCGLDGSLRNPSSAHSHSSTLISLPTDLLLWLRGRAGTRRDTHTSAPDPRQRSVSNSRARTCPRTSSSRIPAWRTCWNSPQALPAIGSILACRALYPPCWSSELHVRPASSPIVTRHHC
jgi:hypothetical protein